MTAAVETPTRDQQPGPKPLTEGRKGPWLMFSLYLFVIVPFLALIAAIPFAWGWGLGWHDVVLAAIFYYLSGMGVTTGFHRYFTHGSFKARRPMRIALAIAGSFAIQGSIISWVADHRRHHQYSDKEGDPHSPWRYGESVGALFKGMYHAHVGWMFDRDRTNVSRFAPDLAADKDIRWVEKTFGLWTALTLLLPAVIGGLWSMSWWGAVTAFFWAGLVRVGVLHHVTWSVNSICHVVGERPFESRDKAANFWPMAIVSFGESWHNSHHADPTCARHGVLRGQIDTTARLIRWFEQLGWVYDVRWPNAERFEAKRVKKAA